MAGKIALGIIIVVGALLGLSAIASFILGFVSFI